MPADARGETRGGAGKFFVGGLPLEVEDEDLQLHFGEFGKVATAWICREKESLFPKCSGFVNMVHQADAARILDLEHEIFDNKVSVSKASPSQDQDGPTQPRDLTVNSGDEPGRFFVSKLGADIMEEELMLYFGEFGEVSEVYLPKDVAGLTRGFGYVKMADPKILLEILKQDLKHEINGIEVSVNETTRVDEGPSRHAPRPSTGAGGGAATSGKKRGGQGNHARRVGAARRGGYGVDAGAGYGGVEAEDFGTDTAKSSYNSGERHNRVYGRAQGSYANGAGDPSEEAWDEEYDTAQKSYARDRGTPYGRG